MLVKTLAAHALMRRPPWEGKSVVVPSTRSPVTSKVLESEDVEWLPIDQIRPVQTRRQTWSRPMNEPGLTYPALTLGADNVIINGHHRYYVLLDGGWRGDVPIVRTQKRAA